MGFGKDGRGVILWDNTIFDLNALAGKDVVIATGRHGAGTMKTGFRLIRIDWWIGWEAQLNITAGGPFLVGLAHGDYTSAEIEAAIEAVVLGRDDTTEIELSNRIVFPLGVIAPADAVAPIVISGSTVIRWTFPDPAGWQFWAYNISSTSVASATIILNLLAKEFGVWV